MSKMKVKLMSHTPNPDRVVSMAAKLCYSKVGVDEIEKKLTDEQIERFVNMLVNIGHCYDEETEVLTSEGFKYWKDVTNDDKLASFNPEDATFKEFEMPQKLYKRYVEEDLIEFRHKRASLKITEGHRLYCSLSNNSRARVNPKFEILYANDILKTGKEVWKSPLRMKSCGYNKNNEIKDSDWMYSLYGFFIGDGYVRKDIKTEKQKILKFRLRKKRKINYLKYICDKIGARIIKLKGDKYNVILPDNVCALDFRKMFYNDMGEKTFPLEMFSMTKNQFDYFLEGLLNSDGNYATRSKNDVYYTMSSELKDRLQVLCSINGRFTTVKIAQNGCYNIYIGKDRLSSPMFNDSRNPYTTKKVAYKGNVYCATVSTGLLMIRRNGFTLLSGNCSPLEHCSFTFAVEGISRACSMQLIRHRIASYSQQSQRYVNLNATFDYVTPNIIEVMDGYYETDRYSNEFDKDMKMIHNLYKKWQPKIQQFVEETNYPTYGMTPEKVANENARVFLPNACETKLVFTMNGRSLLNFFEHRCCNRAQEEIRELANEMLRQVREVAPNLFKMAGASCEHGKCKEGKYGCGYPLTKIK